MSKTINHEHRYTDEEEEYLRSRAQEHLIQTNHRLFPKDEDEEEDSGTPQSRLNALVGGEGETGHVAKSTIGEPEEEEGEEGDGEASGAFNDAEDDVKSEIEPLKVDELKSELEALGVEYGDAKKPELRDLLAAEWSKA